MFGGFFTAKAQSKQQSRVATARLRMEEIERAREISRLCDKVAHAVPCGFMFDVRARKWMAVIEGRTSIPPVPRR